MQNVKLLLVDDDEDDYLLARDLLDEITRGPYTLDWVSSYEQGAEILRENRHDLCLMDYRLGSRDGIELLRQAQSLGFTGPVILLTGMHQGEVDMQALEAGAVDYLVKNGLTSEQLARSIRYALARREMELERVERLRAEADNRSKSEFLAHLSHELRTPMSAILGFTELLLSTTTDEDAKGYLQVVHRNGKHLLGLLNDILDLSKIEAGKLELELHKVDLVSFITDAYFLMYGAAADKDLVLRVDAPEELPTTITTDSTRLRQVLLNLMGNAIKFTDSGEVVLSVSVIPVHGKQMLEFCIRDTGVGIRQEALEEVFLPFVQARTTGAEFRPGTGLGLAISRQLARRLGGDIQVSSQPGEGSEFRFSLDPGDLTKVKFAPFELAFDTLQDSPNHAPRFKGRVLVVDDLRDIRVLIGHFVAMTGVEVKYARDGEEALRVIAEADGIKEPRFDVVLMDIHMPIMGGHEAAKKLREKGFKQPLVALTAANMKGDMDACLEAGFTAYLSKPVDQHQVHTCLAQFLKSGSGGASGSPQKTILLVEDDPDARNALSALLELMEYRVVVAATGLDALKLIEEVSPSLILLDLQLPDMDGYQLADQLRKRLADARMVILSGASVDPLRAKSAGITESLLKPVDLAQLKRIL